MQLKERDGIACDYCGTSYRNDFDYLSFDFHMVNVVDNHRIPIEQILRTNIVFSIDICTSCFDSFKQKIIENYKKIMSPKRRANAQTLCCDWTGDTLNGTYTYYYCVVTKAYVRLTGQPNVCIKCGAKTFDDDKPCNKCQGTDFTRPASIDSEDRFLELVLCEDAYNHFVDKAKSIRKIAGEWSTKSGN